MHQWILDVHTEANAQLQVLKIQDDISNAKMVELPFSFPEEYRQFLCSNKHVMCLYATLAHAAYSPLKANNGEYFNLDILAQESDPYVWGIV